jgi:hypothetical protein
MNLDSDTCKLMLLDSTYTPDLINHASVSDLTGELADGNGYTAGGIELEGVSISVDSGTGEIVFNCSNLVIMTLTATYRYIVIIDDTPTNKPLLILVDQITDQIITDLDYVIVIDPTGLAGITV